MFGIKKGNRQKEQSDVTLGVSSPLEPSTSETIMTQETIENVIASKEKNVLWAKILIAVITVLTIFLGLYKFADYLNRPKTLFYAAIESSYSDFSSVMMSLKEHNLISLINDEGMELNSDIKLDVDNLGEEYAEVEDVINKMSYTSNIKIDKSNNYMGGTISVLKDSEKKMNITLVDDDFKTFVNVPEVFNYFIEFDMGEINIDAFDPEQNLYVGEIIKREVLKMLDDENFASDLQSIAINGTMIECKKSTYVFTGTELKALIDNIFASIKSDSDAYYYLALLNGGTAGELDAKFTVFKSNLNVVDSNKYAFSAYTKVDNDEAVRLELTNEDSITGVESKSIFAYNKNLDYRAIEYTISDEYNLIELKGDINKSFELTIRDGATIFTIDGKNEEGSTKGNVEVTSAQNDEAKMSAEYNYMIDEQAGSTYSISFVLNVIMYENSEETTFNINTSTLLTSNIDIKKIEVGNATNIDDMNDQRKEDIIKDITDYLVKLDEEVPPSETDIPTDDTTTNEGVIESGENTNETNTSTDVQ